MRLTTRCIRWLAAAQHGIRRPNGHFGRIKDEGPHRPSPFVSGGLTHIPLFEASGCFGQARITLQVCLPIVMHCYDVELALRRVAAAWREEKHCQGRDEG